MSFLTLGAAVVAGFIAYNAYIASLNAVAEAKRQADEAKRQANAAELQIAVAQDTAQRQLRAYLFVFNEDTPLIDELATKGIKIMLKNYGQTPAYDVAYWFGVDLKEIPLASELQVPTKPPTLPTRTVLNPGQTNQIIARTGRALRDEEKQSVFNRTHGVYVYGVITYRHAFDRPHTSKFRYVYETYPVGDGVFRGMRWDEHGNEAD